MMMNSPSRAMTSPLPFRATPRALVIGLIGFLTLVDLFAAQAILPSLTAAYGVSPAAMGFAVNASTIGMAAAGLAVSLAARRLERRRGIWLSLALLAIPTAALASAPDLATFTALRIAQGVLMAAAFTLTMAYLAERAGPQDAAAALAAYVTGVVASNLVGRLVSGTVADLGGLAANFYVFAGLNLAGAALVALTLRPEMRMAAMCAAPRPALAAWAGHLANPALRAAFAIGFLILFVFIGVFTYVNFELARPPLGLAPMHLGLVYLVFLPAMVTTPLAGRAVRRWGARATMRGALIACITALPMVEAASLGWVLAGLAVIGVGTFFAQAVATGFVGRAAASDRAAASGLYLAAYYLGGLAGAALLGQLYDRFGWITTVGVIGMALTLGLLLSARLMEPGAGRHRP
jgi:predicted MFS family arabinose efflux permease